MDDFANVGATSKHCREWTLFLSSGSRVQNACVARLGGNKAAILLEARALCDSQWQCQSAVLRSDDGIGTSRGRGRVFFRFSSEKLNLDGRAA